MVMKFNTEKFRKTFNGDPVVRLIFIENASWDKFHELFSVLVQVHVCTV